MVAKSVTLSCMLASVFVSPFAAPEPEAQFSLPPLIPEIPGFTDPISKTAPPTIVLQPPTPPLESPPFTGSDLKPKKIGYFFAGAGDNQHKGRHLFWTAMQTHRLTKTQTFWLSTVSMM